MVTLGRLTAGEAVEREGRTLQVQRSTRRVPVYLAAKGRKRSSWPAGSPTA
jgi:hypothetical protein